MSWPRFVAWVVAVGLTVWGADAAPGQATSSFDKSSAGSRAAYPTKPIRIVTAPAGAGNDLMARVIAQGLSGSLGQQMVVDNRPAGIIGELVAKAPADGYTLLAVGSVLWLTPFLQDSVGYDPVKDFSPISVTSRSL